MKTLERGVYRAIANARVIIIGKVWPHSSFSILFQPVILGDRSTAGSTAYRLHRCRSIFLAIENKGTATSRESFDFTSADPVRCSSKVAQRSPERQLLFSGHRQRLVGGRYLVSSKRAGHYREAGPFDGLPASLKVFGLHN